MPVSVSPGRTRCLVMGAFARRAPLNFANAHARAEQSAEAVRLPTTPSRVRRAKCW